MLRTERRAEAMRLGIAALMILTVATPAHATPRGKRRPAPVATGGPSQAPSSSDLGSGMTSAASTSAAAGDVVRPGASCVAHDVLTYHGGALIMNPDVVLIFWGSQWSTDQAHIDAKAALVALYQQIGTSGYACSWTEYALTLGPAGIGTYDPQSPDVISSNPTLTSCMQGEPAQLCDSTIRSEIVAEVGASRIPAPTDSTVYIVATPQGVPVEASDGSTGCGGTNWQFCGYHDSFTANGYQKPFRYAVLPFPCAIGNFTCITDPLQTAGGSLEIVGSHELGETATDPDSSPGGWYSDRTLMENADICAGFRCETDVTIGAQSFPVNPLWSNLAKGCIASIPCAPPTDCTEGPPGDCVQGLGTTNQCGLEFIAYPDLASAPGGLPGRTVSCTDGQPFCDFDSLAGQCTFHVAACLNNADQQRFPSCAPTSVSAIRLMQPSPTSSNGTDQANAGRILTALSVVDKNSTGSVAGAQVAYNPAAATANACTGSIDVVVPLHPLGTRTLRGLRTISVAAQTAAGVVRNRLTLVCNPGPF